METLERRRAHGLRVTHADGRQELLRDRGGYYEDAIGDRVENPTFAPGTTVEVVLPPIAAPIEARRVVRIGLGLLLLCALTARVARSGLLLLVALLTSQLYPTGKKKLLDADIDLLVDNLKLLLIDTADETYNAADEFHSNITGAGIVATSGNLAGKTTTAGVFDFNDITISGVTGDTVEAIVLYKDTGTSSTSPLIAWWDVSTFTPNGSDVTVVVNASGAFAI